ncbi:LacI family DNA-binding transcriptional regulator [Maribacter polysiphoniae]|uniref:LacI family DNA-binding transcriptional regulator n=1 Tax=Maribacter polysiphoniae TaxID=429344 RepID=A0A316EA28_9FLAO|nr:LacI family DNA-binding transcriptional regulator [Maribacter polysiphoniae]MBD1260143.1 LacI family DNA-binding transcriptional regulator [Maribacter polysiphoniae]PWK25603.1 LacI family transcriptional regulator [Maribacter polysiphoniae]
MAKKRTTTLKELANELKLSISTVSRALNDHPDISPATKEIVKNLAKKKHYAPNLFARGFRSQETHILGVIVPNISHLFTSTILKGILEEAEFRGYRVIISESQNNESKQIEMLKTMTQFGVDGILMSLAKKTAALDAILQILNHKPMVLFDKVSDKIPCTQIVIDEEEAAYNAVEHLINLGKKRIAILKETENSFNSEKRYAGYLRALRNNEIAIDEKIILSTEDISLKNGSRLTRMLLSLKKRPDAIFAITDNAAIGAIKALHKFNVKIPQEIAVVGFSNSVNSTIIQPALTTVDQPGDRIGRTAVAYLIKEIENPDNDEAIKTVEIKTSLLVRDSSFTA